MPPTIMDRIAKLKQARQLLDEAALDIDIPQIETLLHDANTSVHWALWNMGEVDDLRPELESLSNAPVTI